MAKSKKFSLHNSRDLLFFIGFIAILAGFILSILSWMHICTTECEAGHKYRLYGFPLDPIGVAFFLTLAITHLLSRFYSFFFAASAILTAGAVGSEITFILVQKLQIGTWCPICLSIATAVGITAITYVITYSYNLTSLINENRRSDIMKYIWSGFGTILILAFGFVFSSMGIAKFNELQSKENSVKDSIAFGNLNSPIEVYIFTDWQCPGCRRAEPIIEQAAPKIMARAKVIFVDFVIHPDSMNFIPYNLAFMIKNKPQYFELRNILTKISLETGSPTDEQVEQAISKIGVTYRPLNYSDIAVGLKYFKHLGKQFNIDGTPTIVIANKKTMKGKKISGSDITEDNLIKALDSVSGS